MIAVAGGGESNSHRPSRKWNEINEQKDGGRTKIPRSFVLFLFCFLFRLLPFSLRRFFFSAETIELHRKKKKNHKSIKKYTCPTFDRMALVDHQRSIMIRIKFRFKRERERESEKLDGPEPFDRMTRPSRMERSYRLLFYLVFFFCYFFFQVPMAPVRHEVPCLRVWVNIVVRLALSCRLFP